MSKEQENQDDLMKQFETLWDKAILKAREEGFLAAREKPDPYYNAPEYRYEKVEDYLKKFKQ